MEEPTADLQVKVTGNTDGWELSDIMSSDQKMLICQTQNFQCEDGHWFSEFLVEIRDRHLLPQGSQKFLGRIFRSKTGDHM